MTSSTHESSDWGEKPASPPLVWKLPNRLLVAEDAQCVLHNLKMILRKMNVTADMVENGQLACDMVEKSKVEGKPYDLILMDMQMPQMNGYKAVEHLRQQGWKGPIVAVTAFAGDNDHEKILKAGCDACVSKPLNEAKLRDIFARHLDESCRVAAPEPPPRAVRLSMGEVASRSEETVVGPITFL